MHGGSRVFFDGSVPGPPVLRENLIGLDSGGVLCRSGLNLCPSNRFLGDQPADTGDTWFPFGVWTRRQGMASDDQARLGPSRWTRRGT
jgi:hypothetical protein